MTRPGNILLTAIILLVPVLLPAREKSREDSLVHLLSAEYAQQITEDGIDYRRVRGDARFLHNGTHLLCDSASWNLSDNVIDAFGNVRLLQEGTTVTSETLRYVVDENTAKFRGDVVELLDKDGNLLRTGHLDYNTKDSTALFMEGGAMKSRDGDVIESVRGDYDSKTKIFIFEEDVRLYMDSIFLSTTRLDYFADSSMAIFGPGTNAWKEKAFIRSDAGWYNRKDTVICFRDNVYGLDDTYEMWTDSLVYDKASATVELFRNVSILDTIHRVALVGDYLRHEQDSMITYLLEEPAVIYYGSTDAENRVDTLFMRADSLIFKTFYKCDIPQSEVDAARQRRSDVLFDALAEYRSKQAEENRKKIEDGLRAAGKLPPLDTASSTSAPADTTAAASSDSTALSPSDSTSVSASDSIPPAAAPVDSSKVNTVSALHNFRMFREDMQASSDTLTFMDLDSIAILLGRPVMWNTSKNQLTSQVMHLLVKDGDVERGSMLEDARLTSKEAEDCYNQIKSTEMMGFFTGNELYRYDALGNVTAILYMEDHGKLANVNLKESKSLTSLIHEGKAQRMLYMESIKSDVFPIREVEQEKRYLKGFEWRGEERPVNRLAITSKPLPLSDRSLYADVRKPIYQETDNYFDNYMVKVYESIRLAEEAERLRKLEEQRIRDSIAMADSLALAAADTADVAADKETSAKSAKIKYRSASQTSLSRAEKRSLNRAERVACREAGRAQRRARRERQKAIRLQSREQSSSQAPAAQSPDRTR